ncbi:MAG: hypothetical protein KatS3mg105_4254 [Gemmatales bacterium]|nr:MAG: hypothetical protein KatS3mg105_4254 [Gemmatales bacterium]
MHRKNLVPCRAFLMTLVFAIGNLCSTEVVQGQEKAPPPRPEKGGARRITRTERISVGATLPFQMSGTPAPVIRDVHNPNPEILSYRLAPNDPRTVLLTGLQAGTVLLTLTPAVENRPPEVWEIIVQLDVTYLRTLLRDTVPTANLEIVPATPSGATPTVVISGTVARSEDIEQVISIATAAGFTPINAMRVGSVMQVQLDVVVATVNRQEFRNMAFDFLSQGANHIIGSSVFNAVQVVGFTRNPNQPLQFQYQFTGAPNANGSLFLLNNEQEFFSFLQLLRNEQLGKLLAKPRLVTMSGRQAYFLAGGEQAVPAPGGLGAVSVTFQPFGTSINFLPIVLGNGKIYLEVEPEVSRLDAASGTSIGGTVVPGRVTQRVRTSVEMEPGQTFVIGGLIQNEVLASTAKWPVLGDLPYIGTLFSQKSYQEIEQELIIMVTPHLVDPLSCDQVPKVLPGQETRTPDDFELFLEGILEAPRGPREVWPNGHYVPAYKNGPSASVFPCGDPSGMTSGTGCGCESLPKGLANDKTIVYPENRTPAERKQKDDPKRNAQLLPPVELDEASEPEMPPAGAEPMENGFPESLPSVFGPDGLNE